jgi:hypothetical protein
MYNAVDYVIDHAADNFTVQQGQLHQHNKSGNTITMKVMMPA